MAATPKTSMLIQVYGTDSCSDTAHVRRTLEKYNAPYEYVDIERNPDAGAWVDSVVGGERVTPVLDFYGRTLVQPDEEEIFSMLKNSGVRAAG